MITDVFVVYNDKSQIDIIQDAKLDDLISFVFINENSKKERKKAFNLKSHWAAKMTPFAICMNGDKAVKAFYSETGENVIESLINYLNE